MGKGENSQEWHIICVKKKRYYQGMYFETSQIIKRKIKANGQSL